MSGSIPNCPICDKLMDFSGYANYYDRSSRYRTPIYYCKPCDTFYRDINSVKMVDHYYAASYVQEENEARFFRSRMGFFEFVLSLAEKYNKAKSKEQTQQLSLVDFGSSYGHLLELAKTKAIEAVGIELNQDLLVSCRAKGLSVYKDLKEVPKKMDVVTSIDSLYCVPNCREILTDIKNCLKPSGILIARLTNRNLYAKFVRKYVRKGDLSVIGDVTISYSLKGIKKLLALTGFRVIKVIPDYGKGKKLGFRKNFYYRFSYMLTLLTGKRVILTPGIFVVAEIKESC